MNKIVNPLNSVTNIFIKDSTSDDNIKITESNVSKYFKYIYVMCPIKNDYMDEIYNLNIDIDTYKKLMSKMILYKVSSRILKNPIHFTNLKLIDKEYVENANHFDYPIYDKILILTIYNISFLNLKNYLDNFEENSGLKNLYDMLVINEYFSENTSSQYKNNMYLKNVINNIQDINYWSNPFNCKLNMTNEFNKRKFNISKFTSLDSNLTKLFNSLNELEIEDNYIEGIFKFKNYMDPSNIINKKGYKLYYIQEYNEFSKEDIYNIMLKLSEENAFNLFCKLLVSKKYCHLVFYSNTFTLLQNYINIYMELIQYLMGYTWLRFYMEESIKRSRLKTEDNIILTIDIASKLPVFPITPENIEKNPYLPLMIASKFLNPVKNINGITNCNFETDIHNHRICNLTEFRERLNIFISGNKYIDYLADIDFKKNKLAITGSTMTACLQYRHPLVTLFASQNNNTIDKMLYRYFNEYYCESDIDVMVKTEDHFEFFDIGNRFYDQLNKNISKDVLNKGNILLNKKFIKTNYVFVSEEFIKEYIVGGTFTFESIICNLESDTIKTIFHPWILKIHDKKINNYLSDFTNDEIEILKQKYPQYFHFDIQDVKIRLKSDNKKMVLSKINGSVSLPDEKFENEVDTDIDVNDDLLCILFNFKLKISSPWLDHSFEIFPIRGDDFFGVVNTFHLPCVRAYYDGSNVYMTPSCVSAHLTFMNLNYKYVAGTKDPLDIINKYRMRGFGTFLNKIEIKLYFKYISKNKFWNNLFNFDIKNNKTYKNVLGFLNLNHKLFHPRLYNAEHFNNNQNIRFIDSEQFNYVQIENNNEFDYIIYKNYLKKKYNCLDLRKYLEDKKFQSSLTGYIIPYESQLIDYILETFKKFHCEKCNKLKTIEEFENYKKDWTRIKVCNSCYSHSKVPIKIKSNTKEVGFIPI